MFGKKMVDENELNFPELYLVTERFSESFASQKMAEG